MKDRLLTILVLLLPSLVFAQEKVVPLQVNAPVKEAWQHPSTAKSRLTDDTLSLPFMDDFSSLSVYPDPRLWSDSNVYINATYGVAPPTLGVATLDAIDKKGKLYPDAVHFPFVADHLTSRPVDLGYPPTANIYLSFFYQAKGIADPPERDDSLCLDMWAPLQQRWITVWNTGGDTLSPDTVKPFRPVLLPVTDTAFLHKGFRFRFRNYASISPPQSDPGAVGNCDQWNIDYVLLDRNRFDADTVMHDVAMTEPLHSLLNTYQAMPWHQFRETFLSEMGDYLPVTYRNNDTIVRNVTRNFVIEDLSTGKTVHEYTGGATNMPPLTTTTFNSTLIYTYNSSSPDSVVFRVRGYLISDDFDPKVNDTVSYDQVFKDYFAYDDGSAEAGYGLSGTGTSNTSVAIRFHSYRQDTLRGVRFYFNEAFQQGNNTSFNMGVWKDSLGNPGDLISMHYSLMPVFTDSLNRFVEYRFDSLIILPEGDFYVGWKQNSEVFLNIGFDLNLDHSDKVRFLFNGQWWPSSIRGTIMLRPVMGGEDVVTWSPSLVAAAPPEWKVFPLPASGHLRIDYGKTPPADADYLLYDLSGRVVLHHRGFTRYLSLPSLHSGIYLLIIRQDGQPLFRTRIPVIR